VSNQCDGSRGIDDRDRPSERTRGRRLVPSAKGPTGGHSSANRNRDIGDPGHKGFVHFEIAIREIPMSGVQLSAQQRRRTEA
jgi:hypothetical protein